MINEDEINSRIVNTFLSYTSINIEELKLNYDVDKVTSVVEVFKEYYGEPRVDFIASIEDTLVATLGTYSLDEPIMEKCCDIARNYDLDWDDEDLEDLNALFYLLYNATEYATRVNRHTDIIKDIFEAIKSIDIECYISIFDRVSSTIKDKLDEMDNYVGDILVHFPEVKISNEEDHSMLLRDVYIKIPLAGDGALESHFTLNRGTYTVAELKNNYKHSHARPVCRSIENNYEYKRGLSEFNSVCLGHGPIISTESTLLTNYDLDIWKLYCIEIDRYVTVESLSGGPYKSMSSIINWVSKDYRDVIFPALVNDYQITRDDFREVFEKFIKYMINCHLEDLKWGCSNSSFVPGDSMKNLTILISNWFLDYLKARKEETGESYEQFFDQSSTTFNDIIKVGVVDGKIVKEVINSDLISATDIRILKELNGIDLFKFKGQIVKLNICDLNTFDKTNTNRFILNPMLVSYVVTKMILILNLNYAKYKKCFISSSNWVL